MTTYQRISFIPSVSRPMYRCGATGVLNLAIALVEEERAWCLVARYYEDLR